MNEREVRIMSYNILTNSARTRKTIRKRWENRKDSVLKHIQRFNPDILGLQECLEDQESDIKKALGSYLFYGEGTMGKGKGPRNLIGFQTQVFELLDQGTFWLSETPHQASKSWDSAHYRVCGWVKLEHKVSGRLYFYLNTHLDHQGSVARRLGVKVILGEILKWQQAFPNAYFVLTGDFNANPTKTPYKEVEASDLLADSFHIAQARKGKLYSFSGIDRSWHINRWLLFWFYKDFMHHRIDHLFVSKNISVGMYQISDWAEGKCYPSDHLPVIVDLY